MSNDFIYVNKYKSSCCKRIFSHGVYTPMKDKVVNCCEEAENCRFLPYKQIQNSRRSQQKRSDR